MTDDQPAETPAPSASKTSRSRTNGLLAGGFALAAVLGGVVGGVIVHATDGGSGSSSGGATGSVCAASHVADEVLPSVVTIQARHGHESGTGSGEIIRAGGYILTNDHVISLAANGGQVSVLYSDGRTSEATIVGRDPLTDLAVLKAADGSDGLPPIKLGASHTLTVGQPVVALGAPLGLSSTVTSGIVSALDRYVPVPVDNGKTAHLVGAIQTDASINPGNSGGALTDCAGELVGVNTAIATVPGPNGEPGGGSVGLGFAIPVDLAVPIADEMISTGHVNHLTVGMQVQEIPASASQSAGLAPGLFVLSVTPGGPADEAGIARGDVVTQIDGRAAVNSEQLTVAELSARSGQTIEVTFERDGSSSTAKLTPVQQT